MTEIRKADIQSFSMGGRLLLGDLPTFLVSSELYRVPGKNTKDVFTFSVHNRGVKILKEKHSAFLLESSLDLCGDLSWKLFTRDFWGVPHKDLNAHIFYQSCMYFFMITQGLEIERIVADWNSGTNLLAYRNSIRQGKSVEEAAFSTWSGRKALEYGYNRLQVASGTDLSTNRYLFYFRK